MFGVSEGRRIDLQRRGMIDLYQLLRMSPRYFSPGRISHPTQTTGERLVARLTRGATEPNLLIPTFRFVT
jgi:hypothetical protein